MKVVLIHPNVENDNILLDSFHNEFTLLKVSEYPLIEDLKMELDLSNIEHLTLLYHYPGYMSVPFYSSGSYSNNIYFSDELLEFLEEIKHNNLIVDLLTCNLNKERFKNVVDNISLNLNIKIRYSIDETGNYPGNWILESDNIDIRDFYFTSNIELWDDILDDEIKNPCLIDGIESDKKGGYYLSKNIVWENGDKFISLKKRTKFDGRGFIISLEALTTEGIIVSESTNKKESVIIENVGILGGGISNGGSYLVRRDQSYFILRNSFYRGILNNNNSGGLVGRHAGMSGYCYIGDCNGVGETNFVSGGIVGRGTGFSNGVCVVNRCYYKGVLSGDESGGITGPYIGEGGKCIIKNCYFAGDITGDHAGGIVGRYSGFNSGDVLIQNCYSVGTPTLSTGRSIASRIFGINNGRLVIQNCYGSKGVTNNETIVITGDTTTVGVNYDISDLSNGNSLGNLNNISSYEYTRSGIDYKYINNGGEFILDSFGSSNTYPMLPNFRSGIWDSDKYNNYDDLVRLIKQSIINNNLQVAYSIKRLFIEYEGPVARVRRSSDNELVNIYINGSNSIVLENNMLLSEWLDGSNAFIETLYDQSGKGRNIRNSSNSSQPLLDINNKLISFNGSQFMMITSDNISSGKNDLGIIETPLRFNDDSYTYVCKWTSNVIKVSIILEHNASSVVNNNRSGLITMNNGNFGFNGQFNDVNSLVPYSAGVENRTVMIINNVNNSTDNVFVINNGILYTGKTSNVNNLQVEDDVFIIGKKVNNIEYFEGTIEEILIFDKILEIEDGGKYNTGNIRSILNIEKVIKYESIIPKFNYLPNKVLNKRDSSIELLNENVIRLDNGNIYMLGKGKVNNLTNIRNDTLIPTRIDKKSNITQFYSNGGNGGNSVVIDNREIYKYRIREVSGKMRGILKAEKLNIENIIDISNKSLVSEEGSFYLIENNNYNNENEILYKKFDDYVVGNLTEIVINRLELGENHNIIIDQKGDIYVWGLNRSGELGLNDMIDRSDISLLPRNNFIPSLKDDEYGLNVNIGYEMSSIITNKGRIYTFGLNNKGQSGTNIESNNLLVPRQILNLSPRLGREDYIKECSIGNEFIGIIDDSGRLYTSGSNEYGKTGQDIEIGELSVPTLITNYNPVLDVSENIISVSCGSSHMGVLTSNRNVYMCGKSNLVGIDTSNNILVLSKLDLGFDVRKIVCGENHSLILSDNGMVYSFGVNEYGNLGLNDLIDRLEPELITNYQPRLRDNEEIIDIYVGKNHSIFLTSEGRLYSCGSNIYGQLGLEGNKSNPCLVDYYNPDIENNIKLVTCGSYHTLILLENGDIYSFGSNRSIGLGEKTRVSVSSILDIESVRNIFNKPEKLLLDEELENTEINLVDKLIFFEGGDFIISPTLFITTEKVPSTSYTNILTTTSDVQAWINGDPPYSDYGPAINITNESNYKPIIPSGSIIKVVSMGSSKMIFDVEISLESTRVYNLIYEDVVYTIRVIFYGGSGGAEIQNNDFDPPVPCLTDSCYILTPSGYVNVSLLNKGDEIVSDDGRVIRIKRIVVNRVESKKRPSYMIPRNKYGINMPFRETYISENHGYKIDNRWYLPRYGGLKVVINEEYINYYSIELPNYFEDNMVVNGISMEGWDGLEAGKKRNYKWVVRENGLKRKFLRKIRIKK